MKEQAMAWGNVVIGMLVMLGAVLLTDVWLDRTFRKPPQQSEDESVNDVRRF